MADQPASERPKRKRPVPKGFTPFVKGDPRINRTKPGPGRVPDAFRAMCRELASRTMTFKVVTEILTDSDHPHFMSALRWCSEYGYGKPKEHLELSGEAGLTIRVVHE